MSEKRISIRTHLLGVNAKVSTNNKNWEHVTVRDISDGGLGFLSKTVFDKGSRLNFSGEVSDFVREMELHCDVEIIFCGKEEGEFLYGVRFVDMPKAQKVGLGVFIELMITKYPSLLLL